MKIGPCTARQFVIVLFTLAATAPLARAQTRMTDKDVENTMQNLKNDAKKFQSNFDSAISKSTIHKTSREKDARELVKTFQQQTDSMLKAFKDKKKADTTLPVVLDSSQKIDKILADVPMGDAVSASWTRIKSQLDSLSQAFNIQTQAK